ncbi:MAG TPA: serine hydrolase [Bryobacteraceae bacterium]|nr:serine hydrolase [Bryobacteraceae bacterium]
MLSRLALTWPLSICLISGACLAQDPARMDQIVQSYVSGNHFMGSVLVARGDQMLLNKGYGSANLEWDVPNSPITKFRLGSVTKQFTAASILLLEERGKLSVQDPVKKYVPDAPAAWDKITIFHLLTHTSGIANFTSFPDYAKLEPFPTTAAEVVKRFRDKPLEFEPGEKWEYSNSGYALLTYIIEKITGGSYESFVQENLLKPLGMKDSGYDSNSAIIAHRAAGYTYVRDGFQNAGYVDMTVPQGAGALYSTTGDLLKWEQGLFGGKVLKAGSLDKMTTPFKNNYAFGLTVETAGGHKVIQHGGGIEGFNTVLAYYPEDKLTVVVLENANNPAAPPGAIANKLAALAHGDAVSLPGERKEITVDSKILSRYVGVYQMGSGANMLVTLENGQLLSKLGPQQAIPIFAKSQTVFFPKVVDAELEFAKIDDQGRPGQLILHQNGRDMPGNRLSDAEFQSIVDSNAAFQKRLKDKTAAPGGEAALHKMLDDLRQNKTDSEVMSPGLAAALHRQEAQMPTPVEQLGRIESVKFTGVGPGGADIYTVKYEKGTLVYRIWLGRDGKIEQANVRPE